MPWSFMRGCLLALAGGLLFSGTALGQSKIAGKVIDAQNKPVPGLEVLLHAVTEVEGGDLDVDTTDANGAFEVATTQLSPDAVYFVATMFEGALYMGDLLRTPFPSDKEYIVQVGVNPINLQAPDMAPVSPQETSESRRAGLAVILLAVLAIGSVLFIGVRRRPPAYRRWLVELARIEEDMANAVDADSTLGTRRTELRDRLKAARRG